MKADRIHGKAAVFFSCFFMMLSTVSAAAEEQKNDTSADPFLHQFEVEPYYAEFIDSMIQYPEFSSLLGGSSRAIQNKPGITVSQSFRKLAEQYENDAVETHTYTMPCLFGTNVTVVEPETGYVFTERCNEQCYQGICYTPDYMLITAYCTDKQKDGEGKHNSVIYVLDHEGQYLDCVTLSRTKSNHAGGITYDPDHEMLWVAGSSERTVNGIQYSRLTEIIQNQKDPYLSYSCMIKVPDRIKRVSFVTYSTYDHLLYAGYYGSAAERPMMYGYEVSDQNGYPSLETKKSCTLPENCNGAVVIEYNGKGYLVSESSYGRMLSSYLYVNELDTGTRKAKIKMPPMLEQLAYNEETKQISGIFESSAAKYAGSRYKPTVIVDRGFTADFEQILNNSGGWEEFLCTGMIHYRTIEK